MLSRNSYRWTYLLLVLFLYVGCQTSKNVQVNRGQGYSFALIGDMPYGPNGVDKFENVLVDINEDTGVDWVLHVGDIKTGGSSCSDDFFKDRLAIFQRFEDPFIFIPGDNEWTDCHRETAGGFDPLERLDVLRGLYYPEPGKALGGGSIQMVTQAAQAEYRDYPEHVRWVKEGVVFAGLHIVGSANSMAPFSGRTEKHDAEAENRMNAAIVWMREAFAEAHRLNSPGVFLMIHANPQFETPGSVFTPFLQILEEEVIRFDRPVVMAHGDSHYFRIDKPLMGTASRQRIENFTRVETFGAGDIHWLRVQVNPKDVNVFSIRQEIVNANRVDHRIGN